MESMNKSHFFVIPQLMEAMEVRGRYEKMVRPHFQELEYSFTNIENELRSYNGSLINIAKAMMIWLPFRVGLVHYHDV